MKKLNLMFGKFLPERNVFVGQLDDGRIIQTSQVVTIRMIDNNMLLVVTANSVYEFEGLDFLTRFQCYNDFEVIQNQAV